MKRIGVTGAFGFLGANFIAALLEGRPGLGRGPGFAEGELAITAFASRTRSNPLFATSRVSIADLDVLDARGMARKFSGLDAIVHFAGLVDYRPAYKRAVWDCDVLGSKRVFDAALSAGVPRLLHVSSICALGGAASKTALADEASAPYDDPNWPISFSSPEEALAAVEASDAGDYRFLDRVRVAYLDAKLAGWELAKAYARDYGLPVVTIFPGTAVGAGDIHYSISQLVDKVWEGRLRLSFEGATSFVGTSDLAAGAILALARGRIGEGYVLAGTEADNLSYVDFQSLVARLARAEGWFAQRVPSVLPGPVLLGIAGVAELALPASSLTRALVLSGSLRNLCSSAKARAELGYEPSAGLEDAILDCRRFAVARRAAARASGPGFAVSRGARNCSSSIIS